MIPLQIGGRTVGPGLPAYIIAEMSANHHGDYDRAVEIIRSAAAAGADAIKVQTYRADTITLPIRSEVFAIDAGSLWDGEYLTDLYARAEMPWEWHEPLQEVAREVGIDFFSAPFDLTAVDLLDRLGVPALKIASAELVDVGLISAAASTGKPLIMSTGMATLAEIDEAVTAARAAGAVGIALLRCNSAYPAPPSEMDLRSLPALASTFGVPVGLSDHTMSSTAAVASVALGACIVEKHMTLSRQESGPDSEFSQEPHEFAAMVEAIRECEAALGSVRFGPSPREAPSRQFRRSLFFAVDIAAGTVVTSEHIRSVRPAAGLPPKALPQVLGRRVALDVASGTPVTWELFAPLG